MLKTQVELTAYHKQEGKSVRAEGEELCDTMLTGKKK